MKELVYRNNHVLPFPPFQKYISGVIPIEHIFGWHGLLKFPPDDVGRHSQWSDRHTCFQSVSTISIDIKIKIL